MFDFRLQVFRAVALRQSFSRAAEELFITQPAVTRHIRELEQYFKTRLFERSGRQVSLTPAGELLLRHSEKIEGLYRQMEYEMHAQSSREQGVLQLGASTTVANYILPELMAAFRQQFTHINISLTASNTEHVEQDLLEHRIDLGIIEGESRRSGIHYTALWEDELVLVARSGFVLPENELGIKDLQSLPFVLREAGSGTLDVIQLALKKGGLNLESLNVTMRLSATEGIKMYLLHADSVAFLSRFAIRQELDAGLLKIIPVKGFRLMRSFYAITPTGGLQPLPARFLDFAAKYNFR